ncbi:MAG: ACT domain-containing protein [Betaproteobacteria bacterium]|nr:ACT domain-containing protein [Betaproteobacteria bacterium]
MKLKITKSEMWKATIDDQPGGAAAVLDPVAKAGGNFEFAFARRAAEMPGKGLLFVTPVKGKKVVAAAQSVGLGSAPDMHLLRIEGGDKPGTTAAIARALAKAGISFRAFSATAIGRNFKGFLVLDSAEDAARASGVLKKL